MPKKEMDEILERAAKFAKDNGYRIMEGTEDVLPLFLAIFAKKEVLIKTNEDIEWYKKRNKELEVRDPVKEMFDGYGKNN